MGYYEDLDISLDSEQGRKYANAVSWRKGLGTEALDIAFLEGHGQFAGVTTIIGFVEGDSLDVSKAPARQASSLIEGGRETTRCVQGMVQPKDLRFTIARVPVERFPLDEMTEDEKGRFEELREESEGQPIRMQIFRGFLFENGVQLKREVQEKESGEGQKREEIKQAA